MGMKMCLQETIREYNQELKVAREQGKREAMRNNIERMARVDENELARILKLREKQCEERKFPRSILNLFYFAAVQNKDIDTISNGGAKSAFYRDIHSKYNTEEMDKEEAEKKAKIEEEERAIWAIERACELVEKRCEERSTELEEKLTKMGERAKKIKSNAQARSRNGRKTRISTVKLNTEENNELATIVVEEKKAVEEFEKSGGGILASMQITERIRKDATGGRAREYLKKVEPQRGERDVSGERGGETQREAREGEGGENDEEKNNNNGAEEKDEKPITHKEKQRINNKERVKKKEKKRDKQKKGIRKKKRKGSKQHERREGERDSEENTNGRRHISTADASEPSGASLADVR